MGIKRSCKVCSQYRHRAGPLKQKWTSMSKRTSRKVRSKDSFLGAEYTYTGCRRLLSGKGDARGMCWHMNLSSCHVAKRGVTYHGVHTCMCVRVSVCGCAYVECLSGVVYR
jgi:hypothetical protein